MALGELKQGAVENIYDHRPIHKARVSTSSFIINFHSLLTQIEVPMTTRVLHPPHTYKGHDDPAVVRLMEAQEC